MDENLRQLGPVLNELGLRTEELHELRSERLGGMPLLSFKSDYMRYECLLGEKGELAGLSTEPDCSACLRSRERTQS